MEELRKGGYSNLPSVGATVDEDLNLHEITGILRTTRTDASSVAKVDVTALWAEPGESSNKERIKISTCPCRPHCVPVTWFWPPTT